MNKEQLSEVAFVANDFSQEQKDLVKSVWLAEEKLAQVKEKELASVEKVEPSVAKPRPKRKARKRAKRVVKPKAVVPVVETVAPVEKVAEEVPAAEPEIVSQ